MTTPVDVLHEWAFAIDNHDRSHLANCFAPDGEFVARFPSRDETRVSGRDKITEHLVGILDTIPEVRRHFVTNAQVVARAPGAARLRAYILIVGIAGDAIVPRASEWVDVELRSSDDERWQIQRFVIHFDRDVQGSKSDASKPSGSAGSFRLGS